MGPYIKDCSIVGSVLWPFRFRNPPMKELHGTTKTKLYEYVVVMGVLEALGLRLDTAPPSNS